MLPRRRRRQHLRPRRCSRRGRCRCCRCCHLQLLLHALLQPPGHRGSQPCPPSSPATRRQRGGGSASVTAALFGGVPRMRMGCCRPPTHLKPQQAVGDLLQPGDGRIQLSLSAQPLPAACRDGGRSRSGKRLAVRWIMQPSYAHAADATSTSMIAHAPLCWRSVLLRWCC
jgi:hypothetical protein